MRRSFRPNFSVHPVGKTMCWIEKWFHLFNGVYELDHYAKFGEYRTMRARCRCENMAFVTVFFLSCAPRPDRFSLEGDIVRTSTVWQFMGRFWCGFSNFFHKGSAFQMQNMILIFFTRWRQNFREMAVKNCENSKSRKSLCPPLRIDSSGIWKNYTAVVWGWECTCAPG